MNRRHVIASVRRPFATPLLAALVGCSGGATSPPSPEPGRLAERAEIPSWADGGVDGAGGGEVTARDGLHYVLDGNVTSSARGPIGSLGAVAWTHEGSPPAWTSYPGSVTAPGRLDFPGLVASRYDLELTGALSWWNGARVPQYFASTSRARDLGSRVLGRQDVAKVSHGTSIALELTGLDPYVPMRYGSGGDIQMVSAGAGLGWSSLPTEANPRVPKGATSVSTTVDYKALAAQLAFGDRIPGAGLIDASKGDVTYVSELAAETTPTGNGAWGLTKSARVPGLTLVDGATTTVSAALAAVPQVPFTPTLDPTRYNALASRVNPGATPYLFWGHVDVLPSGDDVQYNGGYADLLIHQESPTPAPVPLALTYGDPYPASWPTIANFWSFYLTSWTLSDPDGGSAVVYEQLNSVGGVDSVARMVSKNFEPVIGPVEHPRIDGQDLFSNVTTLTASPTLEWKAPHVGAATYYFVDVEQLTVSEGVATATDVAQFSTTETRLALPPAVLVHGNTYVIQITAYSAPGSHVTESPFLSPFFPVWNADVVSGLVTP